MKKSLLIAATVFLIQSCKVCADCESITTPSNGQPATKTEFEECGTSNIKHARGTKTETITIFVNGVKKTVTVTTVTNCRYQ